MNDEMSINTYLTTIESKKANYANKKNRERIMDMESILMIAGLEGCEGERMKW